MKRKIPGGIPGIFPLVGHRNDIAVIEVCPVGIAAIQSSFWWCGLRRVTFFPVLEDKGGKWVGPEQTGPGLTKDFWALRA